MHGSNQQIGQVIKKNEPFSSDSLSPSGLRFHILVFYHQTVNRTSARHWRAKLPTSAPAPPAATWDLLQKLMVGRRKQMPRQLFIELFVRIWNSLNHHTSLDIVQCWSGLIRIDPDDSRVTRILLLDVFISSGFGFVTSGVRESGGEREGETNGPNKLIDQKILASWAKEKQCF